MADSNEAKAASARMKAEKSFKTGNFFAAKQWIQSAATLAPDLPGNAQLVAAYDVHAAAARRAPDRWYAVLGLPVPDPRGSNVVITYDAVRRQHRKLCLLVHPDKNPSAAAGGAFKHVQDAFDALAARHPPSASDPTPPRPAPKPRPPDPAPKPRPQVVRMQRPVPVSRWSQQRTLASRWSQQPASTSRQSQQPVPSKSNSQKAARTPSPPPPPPPRSQRSYAPVAGVCPACGAFTPSGGRNGRCMSCKWSLMDEPQDDVEYDEEDNYYDYDYD
jgi:hypothetical protein